MAKSEKDTKPRNGMNTEEIISEVVPQSAIDNIKDAVDTHALNKVVEAAQSLQPVSESVAPVIAKESLLKDDHIGLRKKGESGMVQIHKSMRKHYENGEWEIIEAETKKK